MNPRSVWDAHTAINAAAENTEPGKHSINPDDPGTCPACHTHDSVVEVDYAVRWNSLSQGWSLGGIDIHQQDDVYETVGYMCQECRVTLDLPEGVTPNWV